VSSADVLVHNADVPFFPPPVPAQEPLFFIIPGGTMEAFQSEVEAECARLEETVREKQHCTLLSAQWVAYSTVLYCAGPHHLSYLQHAVPGLPVPRHGRWMRCALVPLGTP